MERPIQHEVMHMSTVTRTRWAPRGVRARPPRVEAQLLDRRIGAEFDRCGSRGDLEEATGLSHTRIHQIIHGDATGAPQRALRLVVALDRHPRTTAAPLVRCLLDSVETERGARMDGPALGQDIMLRCTGETEEQAREDVSSFRLVLALAPLRAAGWDLRRLTALQHVELIGACAQYLDAASGEMNEQLAEIGDVRVLLERAKS